MKACCGYSLEAPCHAVSYEYPQHRLQEKYQCTLTSSLTSSREDIAQQKRGYRPLLVAHLDVHLTGDQEVAGLIPARSGNILS